MTGYNTTQNQKITSRAIISALVLWLAFCSTASATQLYVNENGWWCDGCAFDPSSYPIQSAVDAADNGDSIFVYNGSYTEWVVVNKRLTLIGEGADVVTVTHTHRYLWESCVFDVRADWVIISGFTVTGATEDGESGIYLRYVDHCNISGNDASGNYYGIHLYSSSDNTLSDNTASLNNLDGIVLDYHSNGNTLMNNTANSNGDDGIVLHSSSDCTLTSNIANSNNGDGIYLDSSSDNIITCNWIQNNTERGFYLYESSTNNNINYNNIIKNGALQGDGSYHWQFYNYQSNPVEAKNNYWGVGMNNSMIDASIYDDEEGGWGAVEFYPFETDPVTCIPTPDTDILWDATNFAGFWYDLDRNVATETLMINAGTLAGPDIDRTIDEDGLVYTTTAQPVEFDFSDWGYFNVVGFMAESYFAGYEKGETSKDITNDDINLLSKDILSKVLIDVEDKRVVSTGASLQLEEGYELKVIQLDTDGGQAQLELMKNGKCVDTEIVSSPDTYVYEKDGKLDDVPIIVVYISSILSGAETDIVVIDGIFQISENYTSVKIGDVYGEMEVKSVIESGIIMKNNRPIDLDAGTRQHVMGDMYFRIADDDAAIRFYPFVEHIITHGADEITTADAVIALQIAVGSRGYDPRWDVSGDGSVTSLDALMILQAAAGSIEVG